MPSLKCGMYPVPAKDPPESMRHFGMDLDRAGSLGIFDATWVTSSQIKDMNESTKEKSEVILKNAEPLKRNTFPDHWGKGGRSL
jgi:hypothetical protein